MPRAVPASVITQMDAEIKKPVMLFELGLSSTIRFAAYMTNITFPTAGNVYTAKAIEVPNVQQSLEGQIGRVVIKFGNVAKDMSAYVNTQDFRGKTLIIKRIYLDQIANTTDYNEVFNGVMERPSEINRQWLTVPAVSGKPLNMKALKFAYQRMCPWSFGGTECNTDALANLAVLTATGTADSGTTTTLVDNALTQVDDFWNFGRAEITKSGILYHRIITDFVAGTDTVTFDVELPFAIDNTCTYSFFKGCDKTWDTCSASNAWGPSADNKANFGGCIHITSMQDAI